MEQGDQKEMEIILSTLRESFLRCGEKTGCDEDTKNTELSALIHDLNECLEKYKNGDVSSYFLFMDIYKGFIDVPESTCERPSSPVVLDSSPYDATSPPPPEKSPVPPVVFLPNFVGLPEPEPEQYFCIFLF